MNQILKFGTAIVLIGILIIGSYTTYISVSKYLWAKSATPRTFIAKNVKIHGVYDAATELRIYTFEGTILPEGSAAKLNGSQYIMERKLDQHTAWKAEGDTIPVLTDFTTKTVYLSSSFKNEKSTNSIVGISVSLLSIALLLLLFKSDKKTILLIVGILFSGLSYSQPSIILAGPTEQPVFRIANFEATQHIYDSLSTIRPGFESVSDVKLSTTEELVMSYISERDSAWTATNTYPGMDVTTQSPGFYKKSFKRRIYIKPISKVKLTSQDDQNYKLTFFKIQFMIDESSGPVVVLIMKKDKNEWKLFDDGQFFSFQFGYSYLKDEKLEELLEEIKKEDLLNSLNEPTSLTSIGECIINWLNNSEKYAKKIKQFTTSPEWKQ